MASTMYGLVTCLFPKIIISFLVQTYDQQTRCAIFVEVNSFPANTVTVKEKYAVCRRPLKLRLHRLLNIGWRGNQSLASLAVGIQKCFLQGECCKAFWISKVQAGRSPIVGCKK